MTETAGELQSYLEMLCRRAKELGAVEAAPIPVADIVVDERAMLKCLAPRCPFYGTNLMCPPNVMPISQFKRTLRAYHYGIIIIKIDLALSGTPEDLTNLNDISEAWGTIKSAGTNKENLGTSITKYVRVLREDQETLSEILRQIESVCISDGYYFAAGLGSGACFLCDECVGPNSACRYPYKARPSMEAMGIDVVATANRVGMQLNFNRDARSWAGLILVA